MRFDSERRHRSRFGRRELLKVGAVGAVSVLGGLSGNKSSLSDERPKEEIRKPKHRVIDIHCHPRWIGYNGARVIENMDAAGIERAWLLSWEIPEREMDTSYYSTLNPTGVGITFRDVLDVAERYPDRFIPGTTVDPRDPHAHARLKAAVDIHRVRVFGEFKLRMRYDDPDAIRLFHYCGELGLPVIFHLDVTSPRQGVPSTRQWWYGGGLENMEAPLRLCPNTHFLGHAPGFWREISADADQEPLAYPKGKPIVGRGRLLQFLDKFPNLHCDLSASSGHTALARDLEFSRKFLIDYQDRMFFGRDQFSNELYDLLISLSLPEAVLAKILGGNALRLVPR
ncbi:MAG: amidohydrolase [Acidobacteria bacterium]|nr:amidohydrolase [Acidobacteriota bacterium]MCI0719057.1 amidohydrolase [Acidobacteriota bacterium]